MTGFVSLPPELRRALFGEGPDAFLEVFAVPDDIEQPAHLGNPFQRSLRHGVASQFLQRPDHQRRVGGDLAAISWASATCRPFGATLFTKPIW